MKQIQKICFVTSSRADFWLMKSVLIAIRDSPDFELMIIATASLLSPVFGYSVQNIEAEGFTVNEKVETLISGDTPVAITKTMGLSMIGFGDAYNRLKPDLLLLPGDRYEMLMAATAAVVSSVPIAHVYGGDLTEGAYDDSIRHAITKMAQLHFVSNSESRQRIIQMGENPSMVYDIGSPALDALLNVSLLSRTELEENLGIQFRETNLLITLHPETMHANPVAQLEEFLSALSDLNDNYTLIFTAPNADNFGLVFLDEIKKFVENHENACFFTTLGQKNYASLMNEVSMVVGNSSSGLYEAPSFNLPTVNIGERQSGRIKAESVIDTPYEKASILQSIEQARSLECSRVKNPYGDGKSAERVLTALENIGKFSSILQKKFFQIGAGR